MTRCISAAATASSTHSMSTLHAPEIEYKPPSNAKKRGAVIGSAPKLNPEGVLAAVREAKAKEGELKRKVQVPPTACLSVYILLLMVHCSPKAKVRP